MNSARLLQALVLFALLSVGAMAPQAEERRPNILFIFTDDQPQNCLGVMGNKHIHTPYLDRLARRGTLFKNALVTTAICCSNRASILTGQHMYRHGITDFRKPLSNEAFDHQHTYNTDPPRSTIAVAEGIRTTRWKYIRYPESKPVFEQLFDLNADPLETMNLASRPAHVSRLSKLRDQCDNGRNEQ